MNDQKVYIVTSGSYSDYRIERAYLDEAEAERIVAAYNATQPHEEWQVEEYTIGASRAEYDGPIWEGFWTAGRREKPGQRGPGYFEHFRPVEYTDEWVDNFRVREIWWTGETPPQAEVKNVSATNTDFPSVRVTGMSKEHVEKTLYDTVAQVKAERAGL